MAGRIWTAALLIALLGAWGNARVASAVEPPRVIFVLVDDSNCLYGATLNGMLAKEAIAQGVEDLVSRLDEEDRVAVITFGDEATMVQAPTDDARIVGDAIRAAELLDRSARLDLAYNEIRRFIASEPLKANQSLLTIVLTDGPMMAAPDRAQMRAGQLDLEAGAVHYAVGIGPIVQHALLRQISSRGAYRTVDLGGDVKAEIAAIGDALGAEPGPPFPTPTPLPTAAPPDVGLELYLPLVLDDGRLGAR